MLVHGVRADVTWEGWGWCPFSGNSLLSVAQTVYLPLAG